MASASKTFDAVLSGAIPTSSLQPSGRVPPYVGAPHASVRASTVSNIGSVPVFCVETVRRTLALGT